MQKTFFILLIILGIFVPSYLTADQVAIGTVFHDADGDRVRGRREPGIAGVAVSNGVDVVITDQKGNFRIPVSDDAIIFVIKPGNYRYPVDENNLPQFYYIHKPEGSPKLEFAGVPPTGPLPDRIDFGLLTGSESEQFRIIVFSDPQPQIPEHIDFYERAIVEELIGVQGFEFGITLGDLVGDNPSFFEPLNRATARIGLPWFHVFGNHDMNFDATVAQHIDESFENVYGPATFAFNQGRVHFIILNSVIYPNIYDDRLYVGGFREEQFRFIENSLRHVPKDHLVVIMTHIPIFNEHPHGETFKNYHRKRLFEILQDRPYTFSVSGHTHTKRHHYFDSIDCWKRELPHHHFNVGTASGDWWSGQKDERGIPDAVMRDGSPKGYTFLYFDGNQYSWDYRVAGKPEEFKMRIYGPKVVPTNARRFRGEIFVNFFQGSENCLVEFKINDGEWRPMRYTISQDPFISAIRYRWDHAEVLPPGERPSNPNDSYHLWHIRVPGNLPPGTNTFYARVTDKLGRVFTGQMDFEVVEVTE